MRKDLVWDSPVGVEEHEAVGGEICKKEGAKLVDGRVDGRNGGEKVQKRHNAHEEDGKRQQVLPTEAKGKEKNEGRDEGGKWGGMGV